LARLIDEVNNALQYIPWSGSIYGFEVAIPTSFLSVYGTHKWFSDKHEDQMLDLVQQEIIKSRISSSADIKNTQWPVKLRQAYRDQEQYGTDANCKGNTFNHLQTCTSNSEHVCACSKNVTNIL
jgi:hypothetical protein